MEIRKRCNAMAVIGFILLAPWGVGYVSAATAVVVFKNIHCRHFIVQTEKDFLILEWVGRHEPALGNMLEGNFDATGFQEIRNLTTGSDVRVLVTEYGLSEDAAYQHYFNHCQGKER